jgi:predicted nuclease with TOPRIM domain
MISLEQVQLLEARISKAIESFRQVTSENAALISERAGLRAKLEANQKRIDELEVLVMRFKEEQSRIEDGIIAALDRLSQFEEAFENSLKEKVTTKKVAAKTKEKPAEPDSSNSEIFFEISDKDTAEEDKPVNNDLSLEGELEIF